MKNEQICFLLPGMDSPVPIGGVKMVLEYANRLALDGYKIIIAYPRWMNFKQYSIHGKLAHIKRTWKRQLRFVNSSSWFSLHPNVHEIRVLSLNQRHMPKAHIYIATAVHTSQYLAKYNNVNGAYFIQDYENWGMSDSELRATYHFDLKKFCISRWLQRIISDEEGQPCEYIPNGFNPDEYKVTIPIEQKNKYKISLLYHFLEHKGCQDSLSALQIVKQQIQQLEVEMYGLYDCKEELPEWIHYHQKPTAEEHLAINNECAIYVAASVSEGWGLTIGEAMMCGQAICCTDIDGFKEMVQDGQNALLSPIHAPNALAANIIRLINDDNLRLQLAHSGNESIKEFTFEKSYQKLKKTLKLE